MIHSTTRTFTYVKLSDLATAYADKYHDAHTAQHDDVYQEFLESVANSKFTWGDNDATFVALDRFCDVMGLDNDFELDIEFVEQLRNDIFVLLEE